MITEELMEIAWKAFTDAMPPHHQAYLPPCLRAALYAIAPRLRAEGMREVADDICAPAGLHNTRRAILARADALDPPKEPQP